MIVGLPKERKESEFRTGMIPGMVRTLVKRGHTVLVETGAGEGTSISDSDYRDAGATIVETPAEAWASELVVKVKEPLPEEYGFLRKNQILFTYLHLAANKPLTETLLEKGTTAIAYESVETDDRKLPLLVPMSEVAGRMAPQVGAMCLERHNGGRGELLGGVPGVAPSRIVILGGGTVGANAARISMGFGAQVTVFDVSHDRLQYLDDIHQGRLITQISNEHAIEEAIQQADLVIGAVLIHSGRAPWLVTKEMLGGMKDGAVIVDVSVDQGGCVETSRPTTHKNPTFIVDGVIHYCVANMPGAVPRTSTFALTNLTMPYIMELAERKGKALHYNKALKKGVNTSNGKLTIEGVAKAHRLPFSPLS